VGTADAELLAAWRWRCSRRRITPAPSASIQSTCAAGRKWTRSFSRSGELAKRGVSPREASPQRARDEPCRRGPSRIEQPPQRWRSL